MLTIGPIVVLGPGKAKCLHREPLCRSQLKNTALCLPSISKQNNGQLFQRNQTFPSLINGGCRNKKMKFRKNMQVISCSLESGQQSFPFNLIPAGSSWQLWALGTLVPLLLSFTTSKWGPFSKLKNEADNMLETAEQITDVVEDVAGKVEEIADQVGEQLPDGGKLRATLELVEDLAEGTAKNAHLAGDLIDKVQEIEDKMESLMDAVDTNDDKKPKDVQD
ncbi:hypothetical protein ERO13_A05G223100v2 [Gossypium hirsutum]|uniref:Uncharacterized protein isoform X1 n=5 Tax=Gossypium TaxID=3633 RepID=A0A1U8PCF4_GOSHI|nr:uncharacterized protein LOC107957790 isoform X1 [Gossypium hirsutum]KAB2082932.1 hypothetical protein ES319_A05G231400v1 [Gossypium barbadense]TYH18030.1 hypothetical protein ES288_A05G237300v1 [Gossypium darwinii]TYI28385.1 hypothetical protein ES332_A05G241200v1 [Gossypium tomentosum]TYJ35448.1 hypothetical protein E1A91_A05G237600v1 [Gossypium mustelinum]KAG4200604.1 hypothetical protein ERO13_A05G223100v2 [Gossypium hirsutum]